MAEMTERRGIEEAGPVPGSAAIGGLQPPEGISELVTDRLRALDEVRSMDPGCEEVKWWCRRTRMVLEGVVAREGRYRGVLSAFDSLRLGEAGGGRALGVDHIRAVEKAGNLLRNLMRELDDSVRREPPPAAKEDGIRIQAPVPSDPAPVRSGVDGGPPEADPEVREALQLLAKAVERGPGLGSVERHDFRLDVRSLHNEMLKYSPDRGRVIGLLEALSGFEIDLSAIRRSI